MAEIERKEKEVASRYSGGLRARIIDEVHGLIQFDDVSAVRIHSKNYVLLIMRDYSPTLGHVEGNVVILTPEEEITLNKVNGCFKLQGNEFVLIIEETEG